MEGLTPERLAEIREAVEADAVGSERELLAEVDRLTRQLIVRTDQRDVLVETKRKSEQAVNSTLRDDSATVAAISREDFQLALDAPYDASCHTCGHTKGQHYSAGPVCMIRDCDCRRFRVNAPTAESTTEIVRIDKYTIRVNGFECVADTVTENHIRGMNPEQIEKFLRILGFRGESATKKRGVTYGDS